MFSFLSEFFYKHGIDLFAAIPLSECTIRKQYLLEKAEITDGTAIIIAVPYLTPTSLVGERNLSAYAVPRDYHGFFSAFYGELIPKLQEKFPDEVFTAFSDHSPIDEVEAAIKCGIGIYGKNHLLITEKYSSYIFLGEIVTSAKLRATLSEINYCENCGACMRACPAKECGTCLSALTQKKGDLSKDEEDCILRHGMVWGCDICQEVCPHTKKAIDSGSIFSKVPYFSEQLTPVLTRDLLDKMDNETFSRRAYAWRGRETIQRNLELFEKKDK